MDKPIRKQFGFNKNVTVKKNGEYLNVYVNHTVYENGELVKEKSRSVWLTWKETIQLKEAIQAIEEEVLMIEVSLLSLILK